MLNLETILPKEGEVPPRPASITKPVLEANQSDKCVIELLETGRVAAFGGYSLIGDVGHQVFVIGVLQMRNKELRGWSLMLGHPLREQPDFEFIDTTIAPLTELPFPNLMTYFVGEADEKLMTPDAPREELEAIARFILPFIKDCAPPDGIDW